MNGCVISGSLSSLNVEDNLTCSIDKKTEGMDCMLKILASLMTGVVASYITLLIRRGGERYSCPLQLQDPKVQGSTAAAFVAGFLTRQKFLKRIRE